MNRKWNISSSLLGGSNISDYQISINYKLIDISWVSNKSIASSWLISSSNLIVTIGVDKTATLNNITLFVIVFKLSSINSYLTSINFLFNLSV